VNSVKSGEWSEILPNASANVGQNLNPTLSPKTLFAVSCFSGVHLLAARSAGGAGVQYERGGHPGDAAVSGGEAQVPRLLPGGPARLPQIINGGARGFSATAMPLSHNG
jgi:hypothetical protein